MLVTPDISEVVEVLPGSYPARIKGSAVKDTKSGDAKYIAWEMEIFGGEGEWEKLNGKKLPTHNTMLSGKGAFGIKLLYKAVTNEPYQDGQQFDTDDFVGREVYVTVKPQKDDPQYMEISSVQVYQDQPVQVQAG